jgi:hypothetical protein
VILPFTEEPKQDPVITTARQIRDHIEVAHQRENRIESMHEKLDAINAEDIDQEMVGYYSEYYDRGQTKRWPLDEGRPIMPSGLLDRLRRHGIDLSEPDVGDGRGSGIV